ncbi:hypothetical protein MHYP_G00329140 [Metynnis hypsauchen]
MADQRYRLYIAVDFGTAFSGYCFQIKGSKQNRQVKWGLEFGYDTPKTPTCILFDEDGKFLSFGYEAVMMYTRQTARKDAQRLYYFDNFKMELYGKELHRDLMITAKNKKQMRALKVFSESLKFMKDHALEMVGRHIEGEKYSASDVKWVLTVPAIWSSAAKQFMREAATEAGLVTESDPERLIVALEPEAASVWCKQLPSDGFLESNLEEAGKIEEVPGTQYMVVDCGGGTIDITVHEVVDGGHLKELHKVSGNDLGGQKVDKNFSSFLREIFSDKVFDEFEENHPNELQRLMFDFSLCKRFEKNVLVQCPVNLQEIAKREQDMEDYFSELSDVLWDSGEILLTQQKMRSLHDDSLRGIERLIRDILREPKLKIRYLFLVGGFALSTHVNSFVRQKFGSQCKVLCPADAQLAVLKGAVEFGMTPSVVESRISLFTYGVSETQEFNEFKHRGKRTYINKDGVKFCDVCFHYLVQKDESVSYDEVREFSFCPIDRDQIAMLFDFYCTESKCAEFVDEPGMNIIGSIIVSMPDISRGHNRSVRLEVKFGFTEMTATATDIDSGETSSVKLDFITDKSSVLRKKPFISAN